MITMSGGLALLALVGWDRVLYFPPCVEQSYSTKNAHGCASQLSEVLLGIYGGGSLLIRPKPST